MSQLQKRCVEKLGHFAGAVAGNLTINFAIACVPVTVACGAAVDLSRAVSERNQVLSALDAAGLAAARSGSNSEDTLKSIADGFLQANLTGQRYENLSNLNVTYSGGRLTLAADLTMDTTLMALAGITDITLPLESAIQRGTGKVELAIVLDNTGSMHDGGKMPALRDAATELLTELFEAEDAADYVKVGVVPYNGMVNIRGTGFDWDWIDQTGDASLNGDNFDPKTNHLDLYTQMGVEWKGCVEMRAAPYDISDDAPGAVADTKFVPFLWPDEPAGDWYTSFFNDYIPNDDDYCDSCTGLSGDTLYAAQQADTAKYSEGTAYTDEIPDVTSGPNMGCGQEVTPLSNDQSLLQGEIDEMTYWRGSGTHSVAGLMWGWRVVSPGAPYTEGVPYTDTDVLKAVLLMTDGINQYNYRDNPNGSNYSGYGYLAKGRLGTTDFSASSGALDNRMAAACEAIKATGVKLFTLTFQVDDTDTQDLYRNCASESDYYFNSQDNTQIVEHFTEIAGKITQLRVAQ